MECKVMSVNSIYKLFTFPYYSVTSIQLDNFSILYANVQPKH